MPRLLLCDDEVHILRAAEFKFRRAGYEVVCAQNGIEALAAMEECVPDALITDCQMPQMDGVELVKQIRSRQELNALPIVMLTAKGYELPQEQLIGELGVKQIMAKPFSPRLLLATVEELLESASVESATAN